MQYCRLMCCCFTPGAKHAWSTSSACQHSEDKGVGQVMCCWMNDSWRVLHRHIALYSFSVWASDSRCQQITKNMGHVTSQQERWCLVPHSGNMVRYGILENVDFFFFSWREWILELLTEHGPRKTVRIQCSSRYYHKTFIFRELQVTSCALIKNSLLTTVMLTKKEQCYFSWQWQKC